ncbi:hypothetical protein TNCT_650491 [Trichonephila clavata]|uniref:Uncharacterized protein n=1 Tax=Trichonephila clavata TaxID=2740835 RepID=A0A8X6L5C7_TRICU|nr:hypothetical protein TNCT_650491 [Trichonephila clavata]
MWGREQQQTAPSCKRTVGYYPGKDGRPGEGGRRKTWPWCKVIRGKGHGNIAYGDPLFCLPLARHWRIA